MNAELKLTFSVRCSLLMRCICAEKRIGGKQYVSISNRNASKSKSRTLCSRTVQYQQESLFAGNEQVDHLRYSKVWHHPAGHAENSKDSRGNKTCPVRSDKRHQAKWILLFLHGIPPEVSDLLFHMSR